MKVWLLKTGVDCINPSRRLIISLAIPFLLTWCINNAHATALTRTDAINQHPHQAFASGDPSIGTCPETDDCAMPSIHDLLCHYRIRTRSVFDDNFQNDFTVGCNDHIPLNSSDIVAAKCEVTQSVVFLNTASARGPPWSDVQSPYLSGNPLGRSIPHFRPAPLLSEFPFHHSSSGHNATRLFIQPLLVSTAGASLVAAISRSNTTKPSTSRSYYETQMQSNDVGRAAG
jgi:hypothetical protein